VLLPTQAAGEHSSCVRGAVTVDVFRRRRLKFVRRWETHF
jgi:hypothetical protein